MRGIGNRDRYRFLHVALVGRRLAGLGGTEMRQPNIILIMTDDMGYSDIGCYGSTSVSAESLEIFCRARMGEDLRAAAGREARSAERDPTSSTIPSLQFQNSPSG